jgi:aspartate/methionine/tyrosine aminotransferase
VAIRLRGAVFERNRALVRANLDLLEAFMARRADLLEWVPPAAGPVAYPALRTGEGAHAFCARVLEQTGVLLMPGTLFDDCDHRHVRIGYGRKTFPEGLARLEEALATP